MRTFAVVMNEPLPIYEVIPQIREALSGNNTAILQAAPGAGKSTILPLQLLHENWLKDKKIIMLEPRRLAAKTIAWRLAEQLGEEPGQSVGYRVRFESRIGKNTRLEIVTEGILTRMLQQDNSLTDTGMVIFDEFHERSLHADLALALCRESQQILRNDLRLLIMSATLDIENLSALLNKAPLVISRGRQFPVKYIYNEADKNHSLSKNVSRLILKALREQSGDVLVFLPGTGDIHRVEEALADAAAGIRIHPLYGDLSHQQQQAAILPDPGGRRKVILATSIAETSLTIEGVNVVVDSGYSRVSTFDPRSGLTRLETVRSTLDTADQRAGRAGRLGPGFCYRMWPESTNHHLIEHRQAEILQADLCPLVLELANWGHEDPSGLTWMNNPPAGAVNQAKELLENLGAIRNGKISSEGKKILEFPAHPRIAHLLINARESGLPSLASDLAAILEEKDPLNGEGGTDITLRLQALHHYRNKLNSPYSKIHFERIERIARQWRTLLKCREENDAFDHYAPGKLIALAYPERIAKRENNTGRYRLANGRMAKLPEHEPLSHEEWIAVAQLDAGTKEGKIFLAAPFDPSEIISKITPEEVIEWDEREGIIKARREWKSGKLIAQSKALNHPAPEKIIPLLCNVIRREGLRLFDWSDTAEQLRARIISLRKWESGNLLPDFSDEGLMNSLEIWLAPFLDKTKKREDFKKLNLLQMLNTLLSWEQLQIMNRLAPEKIPVPSGSEIPLSYSSEGNIPVLAVRLQEVFGLSETPRINDGKIPVLMHLLSPGYKPVQVTQDLKSFWKNTYPEVRKELRLRYPKHSWPEDPWTATAVRGAIKRRPKS